MLCTVGDVVEEIVAIVAEDPKRGGEVRAAVARVPGGRSATAAGAARRFGASVRVVCQLGADEAGTAVRRQLEKRGVEIVGPHFGRTGTAVVLVDEQREATRLVDRGSSVRLSLSDQSVLDGCTWLHVPLVSLLDGPLASTVQELIGQAVDRGVHIALDLVSAPTVEAFGGDEVASLVSTARPSLVVGSRAEFASLLSGTRDPLPGATLTIVTNGARPALAIEADATVTSVAVPPLERLVDRSGRGASFVGGFLARRMGGATIRTAMEGGHAAAREVLASPGGWPRSGGD